MTRARKEAAQGTTSVRFFESRDAVEVLDTLHTRSVNYQADGHEITPENGWTVESDRTALPAESPGEPVPGGPWEIARGLIERYEFADPSIIRAVYHPEHALQDRDMLLEGRFYGLRFLIGVRIVGVVDTLREVDGRAVRSWGWCYRTLEGHLERGEMTFQVWKWLDTGDVEFRIDRYFMRGPMPNPVIRLGWAVFGHWMQVRFVRRSLRRMTDLVTAELRRRGATG